MINFKPHFALDCMRVVDLKRYAESLQNCVRDILLRNKNEEVTNTILGYLLNAQQTIPSLKIEVTPIIKTCVSCDHYGKTTEGKFKCKRNLAPCEWKEKEGV